MSGRGSGRKYGQYYKPIREDPPRQRPARPSNVPPGVIPDAFGANDVGFREFTATLRLGEGRQPQAGRGRRGESAAAAASTSSGGFRTPASDRLGRSAGGAGGSGPGGEETPEEKEERDRRYKETQMRLARLASIQSGATLGARSKRPKPTTTTAATAADDGMDTGEAAPAGDKKRRSRRPAFWDNGEERHSAKTAKEMGASDDTVRALMTQKHMEQEDGRRATLNPTTDPGVAKKIVDSLKTGDFEEAGKAIVQGLDNANANTARAAALLESDVERLRAEFTAKMNDLQRLYSKQCLLFQSSHFEQDRKSKVRWGDHQMLGAVAAAVYDKYGLSIMWKHVAAIHTLEGPFSGKIIIRFAYLAGDSPYKALLNPSLSPAGPKGNPVAFRLTIRPYQIQHDRTITSALRW